MTTEKELPEVPREYTHIIAIGALCLIAGLLSYFGIDSGLVGSCITGITAIATAKVVSS